MKNRNQSIAIHTGVALIFALLAMGMPVHAADSVGAAKRIINTVTGQGAVGNRNVATSDAVYRDERIAASSASRAELELVDGSRIIVGENSIVDLDKFVIADANFKSATINVAKGAFRFISGDSPKGAITIRTPLSTIGIRGTVFDVYVGAGGLTRVVLLSGRITACALGGQCITISRACDIVEIRTRSDIRQLAFLRSSERGRADEAGLFNLTENQDRHTDRWRALTSGCSARAALETQRDGNAPDPAPPPVDISPPDYDD